MASDKFLILRKELKQGRVLLPGDDGYDDSLKRWSVTCEKPAAAVAQPKTAEEVSTVVKFATSNGIAFNVKGGGHSTSQASSAPTPDDMVLDLCLMRDVSVDAAKQTVTFGGGCLWGDVDDALWPHGLATVGGTVSHTGVGGLILHGGFGVLTGLHGMAIDVLVSCQVVLADGSIVTASETENADLFWALRGAGSSFGVVTRFTSRAFPQGDIWGGLLIFTGDKLPALVDFVNRWAEDNDGSQGFALVFGHAPPQPGMPPDAPRPPVIIVQAAHVGAEAITKGPEFFAPVLAIDALMKQAGPMPYPAINKGADEAFFPHGRRYLFGGSNFTTPMKLSTAEAIRDKFLAFAQTHPGAGAEGSVCLFECFPTRKSRSVPPSATAFNSRGNYYNVGAVWTWADAGLDAELRAYNREFQAEVRRLGYHDAALADGVGLYLNYVSTDPLSADAAFGANSERLRGLKERYDPGNAFDNLWRLAKGRGPGPV
ncbi:FAD-linked oxidoreductase-like protein [Tolypocladium paradoxum]|uniref:FAD-linked oxidoreductase-like protein n=1 Tax=Tolypocladium paradoxum TaxID=94208 RepID=A0A2S4KRE8_9HYPO|nr:FAD-linked oxidoreductase-like protein [Tolypocladium paradoxum]